SATRTIVSTFARFHSGTCGELSVDMGSRVRAAGTRYPPPRSTLGAMGRHALPARPRTAPWVALGVVLLVGLLAAVALWRPWQEQPAAAPSPTATATSEPTATPTPTPSPTPEPRPDARFTILGG